jgi:hypothetical protein
LPSATPHVQHLQPPKCSSKLLLGRERKAGHAKRPNFVGGECASWNQLTCDLQHAHLPLPDSTHALRRFIILDPKGRDSAKSSSSGLESDISVSNASLRSAGLRRRARRRGHGCRHRSALCPQRCDSGRRQSSGKTRRIREGEGEKPESRAESGPLSVRAQQKWSTPGLLLLGAH